MINPETLTVVYGLASAVSWGAGDFSGGLATKRSSVYGVIIVSQLVGGLLLVVLAFLLGEKVASLSDLIWGAAAGSG